MPVKLSPEDIARLERALNEKGLPHRVEVGIEKGQIVLIQVERKKLN